MHDIAGNLPPCEACASDVRPRRVGDLLILVCRACGHGRLDTRSAANEWFEGGGYVTWREDNRAWLRTRAEAAWRDFRAVTGRLPASVAEIGCASGEMLGVVAAAGGECWGVDLCEASIDLARRQFPSVHFGVDTLPHPPRPVDAVVALHVVEHVMDPPGLLADARRLVSDEGWLYVRVPNHASLARRALGPAWPDYMADHVHYFTRASLAAIAERAGWRPIAMRTDAHAWPWLGGLKRLATGRRPTPRRNGGAPPGAGGMRLLAAATTVGRPLLWLERASRAGNELVMVAAAAGRGATGTRG